MRRTRVAIIGGGIGGATAGCALAQAGFEVSVHEAAAELKEIGAGVALHPNAIRVLRMLGLEDATRAVAGDSAYQVTRNWRTGRIISRTSRAEQAAAYGLGGATVHRADLLDVIAAGLPEGSVSLGRRCTGARTEGDMAVAAFEDGSEVEADVVIGADGIHSRVREALFGQDDPRFTGKVCYRSVVPTADIPGAEQIDGLFDNAQWLGPHGTLVLYPLRGHELINVVCHSDDENYRHESWINRCEADEVLARYAGWSESVLAILRGGREWFKWALYDRDPIARWTSERVTLLGDAAHPMLPYLGQGACQALEDGAVLATALSAHDDDPAAGLLAYERTRRPRASRVVLTARARGASNHITSPFAARRRDLAIAVRRLRDRGGDGRGTNWIPEYDATASDVLAR
jgi:salicylate hydroxylase